MILTICILIPACQKDCPEGYSGKDCEDRHSDLFLGSYEGYVNCGVVDEATNIDIYRNSGPFDVFVDFVTTPDFILRASVKGDSIFFPEQWLGIPQGQDTSYYIIFPSSGVLKVDTLDFPISIKFPGIPGSERIICRYRTVK